MLIAERVADKLREFRRRVDDLYENIRHWTQSRRPDAVFQESQVPINEELSGPYDMEILGLTLPGLKAVHFIPFGMLMVGAHARVDVRSRLGHEVLLWVDRWRPYAGGAIGGDEELVDAVGHPLFKNVPEGWAWSDIRGPGLIALDEGVFWNRILLRLAGRSRAFNQSQIPNQGTR